MARSEDQARPKLKDLAEDLHGVKTKWRTIGTQLEVARATIQRIDSKYKDDPEEAFTEMMEEWLRMDTDPKQSWSDIVKVLSKQCVGEPKLAKRLARNRCPASLDEEPDLLQQQGACCENCHSANIQMMPDHDYREVPEPMREEIEVLATSLNSLRIKTFRHVSHLQLQDDNVTTGDFRHVVLNPERCLEEEDHRRICSAASIDAMLDILSVRKYLNWQNYGLLVEIIAEYGNSNLEGELEEYHKEIKAFESKVPLNDIKNIIFTSLGYRYLVKAIVPGMISEPTLDTARQIQNGLKKKNGISYPLHHIEQKSPLAIFFIVPQLLVPPTAILKLSSENIEDRVICTLSEEDVLQLMDLQPPSVPGDSLAPAAMPHNSISNTVEIFEDEVLCKSSTTVACKGRFNNLPCAAKYVHPNLTEASDNWQIARFRKGCDVLRSCRHPNVVMFLGLDLHHELAPVLVTELMDESLELFLKRSSACVPLHTQIDICADVAHGLQHIHSMEYIYGDLNASNVLLQGGRAKIGGIMALVHKVVEENRPVPPGSPQCMPMRAFGPIYDESIDCFSFGILAMHVANCKLPLPSCTSTEFSSTTEMGRFKGSLSEVDANHPFLRVILSCLKEDEGECPTAAALAAHLSTMKTTQAYTDSRRLSSEQEPETMRNQIRELQREKNQATIEFQTEQQRLKIKIRRQNSSTKALQGAKKEAEAALLSLEKEKQKMATEHQETIELLQRDVENISKTAEMGLLAMNFAYQTEHLDCKMAKEKAQCLSDKEKEAKQKMMATNEEKYKIAEERDGATKENAKLLAMTISQQKKLDENNKTIKDLRDQRTSSDKRVAEMYQHAQVKGYELPD